MEKTLVLAQLGCGYWGPNLLRSFSAQRHCKVKWVAELSAERRAYVKETYSQTNVTEDWRQVLTDPEVDAVVIATLATTHFDLAKQALLAGKHVFVEKPLATSSAEALELGEIAHRLRRTLMVGHTFLYNHAVRYLKRLMDQKELGDIYYIYSHRLNLGQVRSDVNSWWNLAPHDVSILLYLMGGELPTSISAHGMDYIQPGIEDVVFASLTWSNRVTAHVQTSWLDPGKVRKITVVGSTKMVTYDDVSDDKITVYNKGVDRVPLVGQRKDYDEINKFRLVPRAGDIFIPKIDFQEPLKVQAGHFLDCLRTGQVPLTGPSHGRDVVAILEAGQKALKTKQIVQINQHCGFQTSAKRLEADA